MTETSTRSGRASVLGGGAWGTALAQLLAANGYATTIWAREEEVVQAINEEHVNAVFLPRCPLDDKVRATNDVPEAVDGAKIVLSVIPTQFLRAFVSTDDPSHRECVVELGCVECCRQRRGDDLRQAADHLHPHRGRWQTADLMFSHRR